MWTYNMVKFLFGVFALSAGTSWMIVGAAVAEYAHQASLQLPSLFYAIGWISIGAGFITCLLGVFVLWHVAFDFIKDQTYSFRKPNYDED